MAPSTAVVQKAALVLTATAREAGPDSSIINVDEVSIKPALFLCGIIKCSR